jgi:hypothetical protein
MNGSVDLNRGWRLGSGKRGDGLGSGFKKDLERHVEALYTRNSHLFPLVSGENRCECASGREAGRQFASADSHIVLQ